ncbi:unnamed protein product [Lactuca saligna]|uniref:Uncharacterized protein n=1 Tax=Lactuca saligna TaxID=75948 RepID=A0AA35YA61_LACSI|nr:unnamed protein product [Lactuca saligna]
MVAASDRVRRAGANQGQWKILWGALAGMREEVCDLEAGRQVLADQNNIMAYEKAILEYQVATLEDRSERLEDQVSSLTREKDVMANRLARCQRSGVFLRHVRPLDLKGGNNCVVALQVLENLKSQILVVLHEMLKRSNPGSSSSDSEG